MTDSFEYPTLVLPSSQKPTRPVPVASSVHSLRLEIASASLLRLESDKTPTAMAVPDEVAADADAEVEEEEPEEVEWLSSSDSEPEHPALKQWTPSSPDSEEAEAEQQPSAPQPASSVSAGKEDEGEVGLEEGEVGKPLRWPGWPGASVFRLVVATDKVGGLIGRRGDTIKRLCEDTRARVRVLEAAAAAAANRIVRRLLPRTFLGDSS